MLTSRSKVLSGRWVRGEVDRSSLHVAIQFRVWHGRAWSEPWGGDFGRPAYTVQPVAGREPEIRSKLTFTARRFIRRKSRPMPILQIAPCSTSRKLHFGSTPEHWPSNTTAPLRMLESWCASAQSTTILCCVPFSPASGISFDSLVAWLSAASQVVCHY